MHIQNCYPSLGTCWWLIGKLASLRAYIIHHSILPPRFFRKPLSFSTALRIHFLCLTLLGIAGTRPFPLPGQRLLLPLPPFYHHPPQAILCLFLLMSVPALPFEKPHPSGSNILKQTRSPGLLLQLSPTPLAASVLFLSILPTVT